MYLLLCIVGILAEYNIFNTFYKYLDLIFEMYNIVLLFKQKLLRLHLSTFVLCVGSILKTAIRLLNAFLYCINK